MRFITAFFFIESVVLSTKPLDQMTDDEILAYVLEQSLLPNNDVGADAEFVVEEDQMSASAVSRKEQAHTPSMPKKSTLSLRVGVKNIGNSCWLSSLIQVLLHSPIFLRSLRSMPIESRQGEIVEGLNELDMALWDRGTSLLVPEKLYNGLQTSCGFAKDSPQDAVDALSCICSSLVDSNPEFQRVFAFETRMHRECLGCSSTSNVAQRENYILRLPIPAPTIPNGSVSLSECYKKYTAKQTVEGFDCQDCLDYQDVSIAYGVHSTGQLLFLTVKRVDPFMQRIKTRVEYPLIFAEIEGHRFQLVGVVHNSGHTATNGHYFVQYFDQDEQTWFHADDDKVIPIPELELVSTTAYLLIYERI
jgi:uncharacterized UBP type Zn finger protein